MSDSVYKPSRKGARPIPLSFTGRHLLQSLREAVIRAISAGDWHVDADRVSTVREQLAQYMSELEAKASRFFLKDVPSDSMIKELNSRGECGYDIVIEDHIVYTGVSDAVPDQTLIAELHRRGYAVHDITELGARPVVTPGTYIYGAGGSGGSGPKPEEHLKRACTELEQMIRSSQGNLLSQTLLMTALDNAKRALRALRTGH